MGIKISDLPSGSAEQTAFAPVTNAAGTETRKVTLMGIASLATKQTVGLANVDNTSDANKPISAATQTALDLKAPLNNPTFTGTVGGITKSMVGLGNLDNTSDANKPVSTAVQTALDSKLSASGGTVQGYLSFVEDEISVSPLTVSPTGIMFPDGTIQTTAASGSATVVDLPFANPLVTDASTGDIFDVTLTGNTTLANPTNPVNGQTIRWRITQDGTGSRAVTLGNKFVIPSSATSPLPFSTAANKMDILAATYHAGRDKWDVVAFVMGY